MVIVKLDGLMRRSGVSTQLELAEKTGLNKNTITTLKKKGKGSLDTVNALCKVLNCQPGDLLEYVPD